MLLLGILGGALYGAIPALLKTRFGTNEILTSLMLVYVAQLPARLAGARPAPRPAGLRLPRQPRLHRLPGDADPDRRAAASISALILALVVVAGGWFVLRRTITGFAITTLGQAPRAGAFAGFSRKRMALLVFLISGGLAGLAGHLGSGRTGRQARRRDLARLRLHRDHRRLPRPAQPGRRSWSPGWCWRSPIIGGERAQIVLGMSSQTGARLPGAAAVLRARLRHLHPLPGALRAGRRMRAVPRGRPNEHGRSHHRHHHHRVDAAAARGARRTGGRALRRPQPRRRGHDDHGRGRAASSPPTRPASRSSASSPRSSPAC